MTVRGHERDEEAITDVEVASSTPVARPLAPASSPLARAERAFARGDHLEAGERWLDLAQRARRAGDEHGASEACGCAGVALHLAGRHERAVPLLEAAAGSWVRLQDRDVHAALVASLYAVGRTDDAWAALPSTEDAQREDLGFPELRAVLLRGWPRRFTVRGGALEELAVALRARPATAAATVVDGGITWVRHRGSRWTLTPVAPTAAGPVVPWGAWQLQRERTDLCRRVDTARLLRWTDLAIAADVAVGDLRAAYDDRRPSGRTPSAVPPRARPELGPVTTG